MPQHETENNLWAVAGPQLRRDIFQHASRIYGGNTEPRSPVSDLRHKRKYQGPNGSWVVFYTDKPDTELHISEGFQLVTDQEPVVWSIGNINGIIPNNYINYTSYDRIYTQYVAPYQAYQAQQRQIEHAIALQQEAYYYATRNMISYDYTDPYMAYPPRIEEEVVNTRAETARRRDSHSARLTQANTARRGIWARLLGTPS